MASKNSYLCPQLNNMFIKGNNPITGLRKCIRKLISNAKSKKHDIDIFNTFKNINITLVCTETQKRIDYIVSVVKPLNENKSIYYKLDYELEVYRKLRNI